MSSQPPSPSLRTALIGGVAAAVAAGAAMALVRWTLVVRTVPERMMEWLLMFVPLDVFEAGLMRLGFDAKRYALYAAIGATLILLAALGTLVLRRRWSVGIILAIGLGLWLFVMLIILPLTGAGGIRHGATRRHEGQYWRLLRGGPSVRGGPCCGQRAHHRRTSACLASTRALGPPRPRAGQRCL